MKAYKKEMISALNFYEHAEVLNDMKPSITVTLDYLINSLSKGIARENADAETIKKWEATRVQLKAVRSMYL